MPAAAPATGHVGALRCNGRRVRLLTAARQVLEERRPAMGQMWDKERKNPGAPKVAQVGIQEDYG